MQALALKYRPKNFNELIGQEMVSKSLTHALKEERISHAYLFSGLRGSGKTSSARIFSKALVCEEGPANAPCEECMQCKMANESRHIDIIEMDGASHRKIDDIRDLIEQTKYNPAMAKYKIFIIDEVHMLTKEAFNALLKTLEEPPKYVKFILATTDPLKLPATVLSRTQHFRFKQISQKNIVNHLEQILSAENISYEKEAIEILARSGYGSLRDTLTITDQAIIYCKKNITKSLVASMLGLLDPIKIEEILEVVINKEKEQLKNIILELQEYEAEMVIDELISNLKNKFLSNNPKYSILICERFFRILAQAKGMLNTTSDNNFVLTIMFFMMIEALSLNDIDEAILEEKQESLTNKKEKIKSVQNHIQHDTKDTKLQTDKSKNAYDMFIEKIYDRDYDLGKCLENNTKFISFNENTLSIQSWAKGENQTKLRNSSKIIMQILKATFNQETKIKIQPTEEEQTKSKNINNDENSSQETKKISSIDKLLDEELLNLEKKDKLEQEPIKKKAQNDFDLLSINKNKTPQELQKIKKESIINEATVLFGKPQIEKIKP